MDEQAVFDSLKYCVEVDADGTRRHYNSAGKLHRTEGPAVERANGYKAWYQNGLRHRTDGPAVVFSDGGKEWYQNGLYHRTDGPAVEYTDGQEWWINGEELSEAEFNQLVNENV